MIGAHPLSAIFESDFSALIFELAYAVRGFTQPSSSTSPSAAPYTEHDDEKINLIPSCWAASASFSVARKLTSSVNSGFSSADGSLETAARWMTQSQSLSNFCNSA